MNGIKTIVIIKNISYKKITINIEFNNDDNFDSGEEEADEPLIQELDLDSVLTRVPPEFLEQSSEPDTTPSEPDTTPSETPAPEEPLEEERVHNCWPY